VALRLRVRQDDLFWLHSSLDETLDAAVSVKSSSINYAVFDSFLVCENVDQSSTNSQMLIKVRIIDTQDLICSL
jgi:hypothetical protein